MENPFYPRSIQRADMPVKALHLGRDASVTDQDGLSISERPETRTRFMHYRRSSTFSYRHVVPSQEVEIRQKQSFYLETWAQISRMT